MALPSLPAAALNAAPPAALGKVAGVMNTMQQFGAVFGIAIVTAVFNANGSLASAGAVASGFKPALVASVGLSGFGAMIALAIRRRRAPATSDATPHAAAAAAAV
jgi:hypothetical protein